MNFFKKQFFLKRKKRVLILPVNTGGAIRYIGDALKKKNFEVDILTFTNHPFGYEKNKIIFDKNDNLIKREIQKILALRFYFFSKNIIYNYGRTIFSVESIEERSRFLIIKAFRNLYYLFMQKIEININKILKNKLIVIYTGDDARQKKYCLNNYKISPAHYLLGTSYYSNKKDQIKINNIKTMNKIAYSIYSHNPDIMNVLPKRATFLPYPYPTKSSSIINKKFSEFKINILHVPSHRGVKGTEIIINQINKLKSYNPKLNIKLTILENINHFELLNKLDKFDLVIDQILVGWYGAFAVESMAKGIPVMAFIRKSDSYYLPSGMLSDLPIINVSKDNLNKKIIEFSKLSKKGFMDLSNKSIAYVKKWHSIELCSEYLIGDLI